MALKSILAYFLVYAFSSGMFFLINSEGDFQADLSRKIFRATLMGLGPLLGVAFGYWWQNRKNREY